MKLSGADRTALNGAAERVAVGGASVPPATGRRTDAEAVAEVSGSSTVHDLRADAARKHFVPTVLRHQHGRRQADDVCVK